MLFNSLQFLFFFPIVTIIYFFLPHRFRWIHLLIASCVFYIAFIPVYIFILFFTIIIDYFAGIMIENASGKKRKWFLVMSIVANVGVLAVFKYYNFFVGNVDDVLNYFHVTTYTLPFQNIILPIGLSFHTFQAMSYTIEVYRGHEKAERHLGIYALYVMFYPQLVAGPIERPQNMLHQFYQKKHFDYYNVTDGLKLMAWGMFKKVVIADRLVKLTDPVFNDPHKFSPLALLLGAIFFSFQIFCDFSGYSDIAIGSAKVMGFKLMQNFNKPYQSKSVSEFWKRWHISLSTWFRDYLYISLGGNRVSIPRWYFNLFFVFVVSGFWHGANWTFIVWGALHGLYLIFAIVTGRIRMKFNDITGISKIPWLHTILEVATVYCLVTFAWIFFRANSITDAFYISGQMPAAIKDFFGVLFSGGFSMSKLKSAIGFLPIYTEDVVISFVLIFFLETIHLIQRRYDIISFIKQKPIYFRWAVYYAIVFVVLFFGVYENHQFIYFQF